jgi:hypothetical protein
MVVDGHLDPCGGAGAVDLDVDRRVDLPRRQRLTAAILGGAAGASDTQRRLRLRHLRVGRERPLDVLDRGPEGGVLR